MLSTGMATDNVAEFTNLSIERVRELATGISAKKKNNLILCEHEATPVR